MRMIESGCADCQWWERRDVDWGVCRLASRHPIDDVAPAVRQFFVHGSVLTTLATFGCVQFKRDQLLPFELRP